MAAADPELRRLRNRHAADRATWFSVLGLWWKPVAALTATATALFALTLRPPALPEPRDGSLTLSLIATEGDPVALWRAFGIRADPVLARIALQEQVEHAIPTTEREPVVAGPGTRPNM